MFSTFNFLMFFKSATTFKSLSLIGKLVNFNTANCSLILFKACKLELLKGTTLTKLAITKLEPSAILVKIIFFCLKSSMIAVFMGAGLGRFVIFTKLFILLLFSISFFFVSVISLFTFSGLAKIFLFAMVFWDAAFLTNSLLEMVSIISSKEAPDFIQFSIIKISF